MNNGIPYSNKIAINSDGSIDTPGIDYETRKLSVVARNQTTIVIKVPGRSCWSGNFSPRKYRSPLMMVFRIKRSCMKNGREILDVEPLIEWDGGRKKKEN